ncbi:TlpA family protein disulfide reductase [Hydrobacter penzbergensis]|nr:TlpA disulfide reductase family protein [Hydrobacter penzbergensis]
MGKNEPPKTLKNLLMRMKQFISKRNIGKAGNLVFVGLLLLLLFSPDAKSWVLKQLISVGLFRAEIKKEALNGKVQAANVSFDFRTENGDVSSVAGLKGKVVFINFWATWCPPCRAEMPSLNDLYNQLKDDKRFVFLFINEDEDTAKAKSYLQNNHYTMPLLTKAGTVPAEIYSGTLPTTVVLDKEGKVVLKHEGIADYNTTTFINQLKGLLE